MNRRNTFEVFIDDEEVISRTTNNLLRKLNKKLRNKKKRYEKNPSPEILNEIDALEKNINLLFPTFNPIKKNKKKKFKKKKIDKAKQAREKRERQEKARKERYHNKYYKWREKERQLKPKKEVQLPEDIISFMENPDKKTYYTLQRKYHPDKNKNGLRYSQFINDYWQQCKVI